jgi:quinoprotein glucose dehydrogenase
LCLCALLTVAGIVSAQSAGEWAFYGHDPGDQRFSSLTAITPENVSTLKPAWTFRTGDAFAPKRGRPTAFEATPLYIGGTLFIGTPLGRVMALDPLSGTQKWAFDAHVDKDRGYGDYATRGVSAWRSRTGDLRIFIATIDARLIALDANTGTPCKQFGDGGSIDLRKGLRIPPKDPADYEETSPPAIVGDVVVVGSGVADNGSVSQPSGEIRGFDALTGKLLWSWDPIPQEGGKGSDTWKNGSAARTGAANAWSLIAADPERRLVFIPTGSASPDYYGGERIGDDLYSDSVVAVEAETGKLVWSFQTVHHDLWDYDVASGPLLFDLHRDGETIPAIAVGSKTGNIFILNRETGKPVFGVEERNVPASDVPGESASPTQPFPLKPAAVTTQSLSADHAWGIDDEDRQWCRAEMSSLRAQGIFTPPSLKGTLSIPGNVGGMNWGGMAYDPSRDLLVLPENRLAAEIRLIPRSDYESLRASRGRKLDGDWEFARQTGTPYGMMRRVLISHKGVPCTPPPWSTLVAIRAGTGEKVWESPLGRFPQLSTGKYLSPQYGSLSLGGPILTASGLVFIAGTLDPNVYAFDVTSGKQLWAGALPTSARSTPMTFAGPDGKQYLIVCAGGHGIPGAAPLGDYVVAFRL